MANALEWVARRSWIWAEVSYGLLKTGESQDITLTVDASGLPTGMHTVTVVIENNDPNQIGFVIPIDLEVAPVQIGDVNVDDAVNTSDLIYLVQFIFRDGPEPDTRLADYNCDFSITLADVIALVNYVFKGGPPADCE